MLKQVQDFCLHCKPDPFKSAFASAMAESVFSADHRQRYLDSMEASAAIPSQDELQALLQTTPRLIPVSSQAFARVQLLRNC